MCLLEWFLYRIMHICSSSGLVYKFMLPNAILLEAQYYCRFNITKLNQVCTGLQPACAWFLVQEVAYVYILPEAINN